MTSDDLMIDGVRLGVTSAGIRYQGRDDVVLFELVDGTTTCAVFTQNRFAAAPVVIAREHLLTTMPRYLLINAGNANAGTGKTGMNDARASCAHVAKQAGCAAEAVLPFSTGVIGEYLPMDKLTIGIDKAMLALEQNQWPAAAKAILTTDTRTKTSHHEYTLNAKACRMTGIAKGSGMIHPNMATMLAFISTDASIPTNLLQLALNEAVDNSFNCITVDGDTSTNDACVVSATGQGELSINEEGPEFDVFKAKLTRVCKELAEAIIRDGEGATKFVRIKIEKGLNRQQCREIAFTVALSPLVKTALFGQDPNWGRILAAIGRARVEDFDLDKVEIYLDDVCIVRKGERDPEYTEDAGAQVMKQAEITIRVILNQADAQAEVLTSDLSHDYVSINADYRS
ncbi:MAG: bifunctional glutamate N-acetyltransferase/amino-acid acetyltransferase ArgJ [Gammaproteobacteria bacterium]|nr:MAG: bifunctional glutamate N-acetyltransferase/amino-acid acetyltransferase ArgJ [Gammaproteobacteria bacterium]